MEWFKSSKSGAGNCVEVSFSIAGTVAVRDSKNPCGPMLAITAGEWRAFVADARSGQLGA